MHEEGTADRFAAIGLGSNLGDRLASLRDARAALSRAAAVRVVDASALWETEPVGPGEQGLYLNAALALETTLSPRALLDLLLEVERTLGRDRGGDAVRWGPRTIDLDLLLWGDEVVEEEGLVVPHPRLHERAFVLRPLAEVAGGRRHPRLGVSIEALAARCDDTAGVRRRDDLGPEAWRVDGER